MLKAHEILGTDKPIFKEKEVTHLFLEEITALGGDPELYEVVGYAQVLMDNQPFFKAVYDKRRQYKNT